MNVQVGKLTFLEAISLFRYHANATAPIQDDLVLNIFIGFLFSSIYYSIG